MPTKKTETDLLKVAASEESEALERELGSDDARARRFPARFAASGNVTSIVAKIRSQGEEE